MSSSAKRVAVGSRVEVFDWNGASAARGQESAVVEPYFPGTPAPPKAPQPGPAAAPAIDQHQQARLAAIEREAFAKGYEQGERAGAEAGATRAEAMLRRLAQTLEELADVRRSMIHQTERQMVQLALAIAKRVVRREVAIDRDLTLTMARVALDRLGDSTTVTIRLNPADFEATAGRRDVVQAGSRVTVVADSGVSRGGCRVESDFGYVDASVDAQFQELARALLVDEGQDVPAVASER